MITKTYKKYEILLLKQLLIAKDSLTAAHSLEVGHISVEIAKEMMKKNIFFPYSIEAVGIAGFLHDIGKLKMQEDLLKGQQIIGVPRNNIEIKKHSITGYEILNRMDFDVVITQAVLYHHERYDGSGYPFGLKKNNINIISRIIGVADSFSAITQKRPYKNKKTKEEAIEIMNKERYLFDPEIFEIFLHIINTEENNKYEKAI